MSAESREKGILQREIENLEQIRDEVRVQAHLLKSDMKTELEALDKRFERLRRDMRTHSLKRAAEESVVEISDATRLLVDTIRDGLTRVRKSLTPR